MTPLPSKFPVATSRPCGTTSRLGKMALEK